MTHDNTTDKTQKSGGMPIKSGIRAGSDDQQLHAIVSGKVQGVGFRAFTERQARDLGLSGWVRNLSDGTVEVTAEGPRSQLKQLVEYLKQGPTAARVDNVDVQWRNATNGYDDFSVRFR